MIHFLDGDGEAGGCDAAWGSVVGDSDRNHVAPRSLLLGWSPGENTGDGIDGRARRRAGAESVRQRLSCVRIGCDKCPLQQGLLSDGLRRNRGHHWRTIPANDGVGCGRGWRLEWRERAFGAVWNTADADVVGLNLPVHTVHEQCIRAKKPQLPAGLAQLEVGVEIGCRDCIRLRGLVRPDEQEAPG